MNQMNLLINDLGARLEGKEKVQNEEVRKAAFAVEKVEKYWSKHGLKVLSYDDQGVNIRRFLTMNKKARFFDGRINKKNKDACRII